MLSLSIIIWYWCLMLSKQVFSLYIIHTPETNIDPTRDKIKVCLFTCHLCMYIFSAYMCIYFNMLSWCSSVSECTSVCVFFMLFLSTIYQLCYLLLNRYFNELRFWGGDGFKLKSIWIWPTVHRNSSRYSHF